MLRKISCPLLALTFFLTGPGGAALGDPPPEVLLVSSDHGRFGEVLHPRIEVTLDGDESIRSSLEEVFDAELFELLPDDSLANGSRLTVQPFVGARSAVLLAFDISRLLELTRRVAEDITAVSIVLYRPPELLDRVDRRLPFRLGLFAPPDDSSWGRDGDASLETSWSGAGPLQLRPADQPPFFRDELRLATAVRADAVEPSAARERGPGGEMRPLYAARLRFSGEELTEHVRAEAGRGRYARFVLFADEPAPGALPAGVVPGAWPSSDGVDHRGSGLARSRLTPPFRVSGESEPALEFAPFGAVVGPGDVLTVFVGSPTGPRLMSFDRTGARRGTLDIADVCATCREADRTLSTDFSPVRGFHALADGGIAFMTTVLVGNPRRPSSRELRVFFTDGPGLQLRREVLAFESRALTILSSRVSPKGTLFVALRVFQADALVEIAPETGEVIEHPVPLPEGTQLTEILFDDSGNAFVLGLDSSASTLRASFLDPAMKERFRARLPGVVGLDRALVIADGRLVLYTQSAVSSFERRLVILTSEGEVDDDDVIPPILRLGDLRILDQARVLLGTDGDERLVFTPRVISGPDVGDGNGDDIIFLSTRSANREFSIESRFPVVPDYALAGGGYVAEIGSVNTAVLDDTGFPVAVENLDTSMHLRPSSDGLFEIVKRPGETLLSVRHYAPGGEFLHRARGLVDFVSPTTTDFRICRDNPEVGLYLPAVVSSAVTDIPVWGVAGPSAGMELFGPFIDIVCGTLPLPRHVNCRTLFCASERPGTLILWPQYRAPAGEEPFDSAWVTARRILHEADIEGGLRVTPYQQSVSSGGTAELRAVRPGGAGEMEVPVRWFVVSGADRILRPPPSADGLLAIGPSLRITVHPDSPPDDIVITAVSDEGEPATAVVLVEPPPRLVPLDPDPNPEVSTLQKGGTAFRYYRIEQGPPGASGFAPQSLQVVFRVAGSSPEVELISASYTAVPTDYAPGLARLSREIPGLVAIRIQYADLAREVDAGRTRLTCELLHFVTPIGDILEPAEREIFEVAVGTRPLARTLAFGTTVSLATTGVGRYAASGSGSVAFEDRDPETPAIDAQEITASVAASAGIEKDFLASLSFDALGLKVSSPSAKLAAGGFVRQKYRFDSPETVPAVVQDYAMVQAVRWARLGGIGSVLLPLVGPFVEAFDPSSGYLASVLDSLELLVRGENPIDYVAENVYGATFAFTSSVGASLKTEFIRPAEKILPARKTDAIALGFSVLEGGVTGSLELIQEHPKLGIGPRKGRYTLTSTFEVLKLSNLGLVICSGSTCRTGSFSAGVSLGDPTEEEKEEAARQGVVLTNRSLRSIDLSFVSSDNRYKKTYVFDRENSKRVLGANCSAPLTVLAGLLGCEDCGCSIPEAGSYTLNLISELAGDIVERITGDSEPISGVEQSMESEFLRSVAVPPDLAKATWTAVEPQKVDSALGFSIKVGYGGGLTVKKTFSQTPLRQSGVLLRTEAGFVEFPLEAYVADRFERRLEQDSGLEFLVSGAVLSVQNFFASALRVEFEAFAQNRTVIDHLKSVLAGDEDVGDGGGGGIDDTGPQEFVLEVTYDRDTRVLVQAWPRDASGDRELFRLPDVERPAAVRTDIVVGTIHDFGQDPPGAPARIVEARVTIGYPEVDVADIDESLLQVARWDDQMDRWILLGGAVDPDLNLVTAPIDREGLYAVVFSLDLPCPVIRSVAVSDGEVSLEWDPYTAPGATGLSVYRAQGGTEEFERVAILGIDATGYTDSVPAGETGTLRYALSPRVGEVGEGCPSEFVDTDTDGDGISDLFELASGLGVGQDNSATDTDGDGLLDLEEFLRGFDARSPDTDGDGLLDGDEGPRGGDPLAPDTDGDGLLDGEEVELDTLVIATDTDRDGLTDGDEVRIHRTDPLAADTDGDGLSDADEVALHGTDPLLADSDDDALDDREELRLGTDPRLADSDGDGAEDGAEIERRTDPLDPASFPGEPAAGLVRPGDLNGDGRVDSSDPSALLGSLFRGDPTGSLCETASAKRRFEDVNGDGSVDVSDAVHLLLFLFAGGEPPALGTECVEIVGCPAICP